MPRCTVLAALYFAEEGFGEWMRAMTDSRMTDLLLKGTRNGVRFRKTCTEFIFVRLSPAVFHRFRRIASQVICFLYERCTYAKFRLSTGHSRPLPTRQSLKYCSLRTVTPSTRCSLCAGSCSTSFRTARLRSYRCGRFRE